jgi:hypothetical protein
MACEGLAVEVKTTAAKDGRKVEINGIDQLATNPGSTLHLAFVRVAADPDGQRISDLLEALVNRGVPRRELLERLLMVGYLPGREEDEVPYRVRELALFEVDPDFPAITDNSFQYGVPRGIESIRYVVDLGAVGEPLDRHGVEALFARMSET